ncbi:MAG: helix-turn-helix transcriptional regulator [Acetobacteraceae bacterium]|nr:helix-turn-helix transcriptional regulator [Acetobacteraceae bacterium]
MAKKKPAPASFAARLRALRTQAGLSAYELARRSGVSKQTLSTLERGEGKPLWETVCRLADTLDISTEDFRSPNE